MVLDLSSIPLFDTHEHLRPESERVNHPFGGDALATLLAGYASTDLKTAGLPPRDLLFAQDGTQPIIERWQRIDPYWRAITNTSYVRTLQIATRDLYGVEEISATTIDTLDARMRASSMPGLYAEVFSRAKICCAIVQDVDPGALPVQADPVSLLHMAIKGGPLLWPRSRQELEAIAASVGTHIPHTLPAWLEICAEVFRRAENTVALKLAHAYVCSLAHTRPTHHEAEQVFNQIVSRRELFGVDESLSWEQSRPLRDFMVHHLVRLAIEHHLPIQVHTGLLENTFNDVRDSHPHHLIPLLLEYREARFVLFHGGYPWLREFIVLGKAFPNVWLDLCWLWNISPSAARSMLHELVETLPANKLCAFGGDYMFVEGAYGHSLLARTNLARVLQEKVTEGWFTEHEAYQYAQMVMHDNATALYLKAAGCTDFP